MCIPAWFAFPSKDGTNVVSGDSLTECVSIADSCKEVGLVGINCTPPRFIHALVLSIQKVSPVMVALTLKHRCTSVHVMPDVFLLYAVQVTNKPILIYPNSGESYDPVRKEWVVSIS